MKNLLNFLIDVLACWSINYLFINSKFAITGSHEDCKLCYFSNVNGPLDSNENVYVLMIQPSTAVSNQPTFHQSIQQRCSWLINSFELMYFLWTFSFKYFYKVLVYEISFPIIFLSQGDHSTEVVACINISFLKISKTSCVKLALNL